MSAPSDSFKEVRVSVRPVPELPQVLHDSPLVHRLLASRGVTDPAELTLSLDTLPRPDALPQIESAVRRLVSAKARDERILIVGDYDCDGATSTAVALQGLAMLGYQNVDYLIPNRFSQGYGLSPAIVEQACSGQPPHLIVTVDNGVASVDGVARAQQLGVDVVVTDHHLPPEQLPDAIAIVNPNLPGSCFDGVNLAGVGVMFYTLIALRQSLAGSDDTCRDAPLATLLDLVAIGTVADVVPLDAINRTLVEQGLRRIRSGHSRPGVFALMQVAGRDSTQITTQDIGFGIGPRLNAAGRLDDMRVGVECLLSDTDQQAMTLAQSLNQLNQERRQIEKDMRDGAVEQLAAVTVDNLVDDSTYTVCLMQEDWHQGVIGILAGRIKESLHRPVVILAGDGEHHLKGSARSIPGIHVRDVLQTIVARHPGMIEKFGGHAMAAGLTLAREQLADFKRAFEHEVRRLSNGQPAQREFVTDGSLNEADRTLAHADVLARVMPWGQRFEAPVFADRFDVIQHRSVGTGHLKLSLKAFGDANARVLDAIAFNCSLQLAAGEPVLAVYSLEANSWRDRRTVQLRVLHLEQAALR